MFDNNNISISIIKYKYIHNCNENCEDKEWPCTSPGKYNKVCRGFKATSGHILNFK